MSAQAYDVIVIGAGPAGENVADRVVHAGLTAVIVESELVGGDCSYWACMPTKALLRSAAAVHGALAVDGARQAVSGELDVAAVLRRRDRFTHNFEDSAQVRWLQTAGINLVRGHGSITAPRQVQVHTDSGQIELHARHAVAICTGSAAALPDIPGLTDIDLWTSRDAAAVTQVPGSLAILGGGVVACELATAFASFGTRVHLLARSGLLGTVEPFAGELVAEALVERGVDIRLGVEARSARRAGDGTSTLELTDGSQVSAERVLVSTGRVPRTDNIGLETVGVPTGTWLNVDDTLRVEGTDWLYAVGDVNRRALLTHQGKYQARAAGDVIAARATGRPVDDRPWGAHVATADHRSVPQVTFTEPEVASVGFTAKAAANAGIRTRILDYDISHVAGAATHADGYRGHARAVIDEDRQVIVGATFVGPDVAELLHAATLAVVAEVPLERLWHAVPAYPTVSEIWLRLLEEYGRPTT